jgi:lipid II:glycine glycyltransferase (peptidoglycan interpeptide bridge formation enzyme)
MDLPTLSARQKPKTRYNIGLAVRHGVTVRPASLDEWDDIFPLFEETSRRDGFPIHTKGYYAALLSGLDGRPEAGGLARLTVAEHQGHVLAAIIVAAFGSTAIYLHGASRSEGRQHMPTYAIQWEAIQWARAHGCRVYDLWGIPDEAGQGMEPEEDQRGGLWGVYRFKRGFGGEIVRYAGALVAVYAPRRYWLWNVALPRYRRLLLRRLNMPPDTNA